MVTDGLEGTVAGQASRTIKTARAADRKSDDCDIFAILHIRQ